MKIKELLKNRVAKNIGWLISGKLIVKILAFLVGIFTARYLGPSNLGLIDYAGAYIAFFSAICTLGINSVIVKHFVEDFPIFCDAWDGDSYEDRIESDVRRNHNRDCCDR